MQGTRWIPQFVIAQEMVKAAYKEAHLQQPEVFKGHDHHDGTVDGRTKKCAQGWLGEEFFKSFCLQYDVECVSSPNRLRRKPDYYDFSIGPNKTTVDVKTSLPHTKEIRVACRKVDHKPCELFVFVKIERAFTKIQLIGWATRDEMQSSPIKSMDELNYVMHEKDTAPMWWLLTSIECERRREATTCR